MHSHKPFYDFFPHLLSHEEKEFARANQEKMDIYDKDCTCAYEKHRENPNNRRSMGNYTFPSKAIDELREKYQINKIQDDMDSLSDIAFARYLPNRKIRFSNVEEAFNAYLENIVRVYRWFVDVEKYKIDLNNSGVNPYLSNKVKNYWYFMEWQSDSFNLGIALFALNGHKVPESCKFKIELIRAALGIIPGKEEDSGDNKKAIASRLKTLVKTSAEWAWGDDEWIVKEGYANSTQESYEDQFHFFVAMSAFWDEYNFTRSDISRLGEPFLYKNFHLLMILNDSIKNSPIVPIEKDIAGFVDGVFKSINLLAEIINDDEIIIKEKMEVSSIEDESIKSLNFHLDNKKECLQLLGVLLFCLKNEINIVIPIDNSLFDMAMNKIKQLGKSYRKYESYLVLALLTSSAIYKLLNWTESGFRDEYIKPMGIKDQQLLQYFHQLAVLLNSLNVHITGKDSLNNVIEHFPQPEEEISEELMSFNKRMENMANKD